MTTISDIPGRVASLTLRLLFGVAVAIFTASLLLAVMVLVAASLLWSLVTGRKATPTVLWQRYRQASAQARWAGAGRGAPRSAYARAEVVDVQAREVGPDGSRQIHRDPSH